MWWAGQPSQLEGLLGAALLANLALAGWIARYFLRELTKHVDACNLVPKQLILDKIEALSEKFDLMEDVHQKAQESLQVEIIENREIVTELAKSVLILVGRQSERDLLRVNLTKESL